MLAHVWTWLAIIQEREKWMVGGEMWGALGHSEGVWLLMAAGTVHPHIVRGGKVGSVGQKAGERTVEVGWRGGSCPIAVITWRGGGGGGVREEREWVSTVWRVRWKRGAAGLLDTECECAEVAGMWAGQSHVPLVIRMNRRWSAQVFIPSCIQPKDANSWD